MHFTAAMYIPPGCEPPQTCAVKFELIENLYGFTTDKCLWVTWASHPYVLDKNKNVNNNKIKQIKIKCK